MNEEINEEIAANTDGDEMEQVAKILKLTQDDILNMHSFIIKAMDNDNDWISVLENSGLKENQKIFIAYIKGVSKGSRSTEKRINRSIESRTDLVKYYDQVDAFEHITHGFSGWELNEVIRVIVSLLKTMMITNYSKERISELSMVMSDDFCRFSEDCKLINNEKIIRNKN